MTDTRPSTVLTSLSATDDPAVIPPIVVEVDKWIRRRGAPAPAGPEPAETVAPARALAVAS